MIFREGLNRGSTNWFRQNGCFCFANTSSTVGSSMITGLLCLYSWHNKILGKSLYKFFLSRDLGDYIFRNLNLIILGMFVWQVLDEADHLLNEDFEKSLDEILNSITHKRRTYLFSATMTQKVWNLVVTWNRAKIVYLLITFKRHIQTHPWYNMFLLSDSVATHVAIWGSIRCCCFCPRYWKQRWGCCIWW